MRTSGSDILKSGAGDTLGKFQDRGRGARPGHLSEAPMCCSPSESSENPMHPGKEVPVLRKQSGTLAPGTAEAADARGRVPRTVPGPGRGSPCCTSPHPPRFGRRRGAGQGPSGSRAWGPRPQGFPSGGRPRGLEETAPGASHQLSTQGLSKQPATSRSPRHQGRPALCSGALGRVRNGPLEFFKENTVVLSSSRLPPHPTYCSSFSLRFFPRGAQNRAR